MPWKLVVTEGARKALRGMSKQDRQAIGQALNRMIDEPGSVDLAKLAGATDEWRLRVGQWRVRLELDNSTGTMYALRVLPRKDAYRG